MHVLRLLLLVILLMMLSVFVAAAQDDACPVLVTEALAQVDTACEGVARNQACYGNVQISALPRGEVQLRFEQVGDITDLASLASLQLSPLNVEENIWGVAVLRVQANLPDSLPGQNVTMVLFGDVMLKNGGDYDPDRFITVTARNNINLRAGPSTETAVVGSLAAASSVQADARTADSEWIRVVMDDGSVAWAFASLLDSDSDIANLPVRTPDDPAGPYRPMQAFYFSTGIGESACAEISESGLLIQTPQGAGTIDLLMNEVHVNVGSTIYLQAVPGRTMEIYTLEGAASVQFEGIAIPVEAGRFISLSIDDLLHAVAVIQGPRPFDAAKSVLPPLALLPETVSFEDLPPFDETAVEQPGIPIATAQVQYHGGDQWVSSGLTVQEGQTILITASGVLDLWPRCEQDKVAVGRADEDCSTMRIGPEGMLSEPAIANNFGVTTHPGALIARIGDGTPFLVGAGGTFIAGASGVIELRANDPDYYIGDDAGTFFIEISIMV